MEDDFLLTRCAMISLGEDGIVRFTVSAGADETLDDAREGVAAVVKISKGKKCPLLADIRRVRATSREVRRYYAGEEATRAAAAAAILVGSPISRMIGSFFLGLNKPGIPVRLFASESEATEWLKGFRE